MPWQQRAMYLIGQPVGVSFKDGTGVSGVLCGMSNKELYLMEYLYHTQFATKHYPYEMIQDVLSYPGCYPQGSSYASQRFY